MVQKELGIISITSQCIVKVKATLDTCEIILLKI